MARVARTTSTLIKASLSPREHPLVASRLGGVLMHVTSLPSAHGIGDLGPAAYAYVDWVAAAGFSLWQMLPIGPVGYGESPYGSSSSFAIEPLLLSLDVLAADGLLTRAEVAPPAALAAATRVNFVAARKFKLPLYQKAFERWHARGGAQKPAYLAFRKRTRLWLTDWLAFLGERAEYHAFVQFALDVQWRMLREHAASRGVRFIGDVPIFVIRDSADCMAHPRLFRLDAKGRPGVLTGVPPDCFSTEGQLWGHPHYRWSEHARTKFAWWTQRIDVACERFDLVRIDHFVGLHHAYEVRAGAKNAKRGVWKPAAGRALLEALAGHFKGALPLIAEDLGACTPEVVALRDDFKLPGMRLLQNAFWSGRSGDMPHHHPQRCVAYPGTHDNDTTSGWWKTTPAAQRKRFRAYAGGGLVHEAMLRILWASGANLAIASMQDLLGLGTAHRMNVPGIAEGNWTWRMPARACTRQFALSIAAQMEASGRARQS